MNAPAEATLLGLGVYRPRRVVPNAEIVEAIDSSDEWIQQRSGIRSRRWAGDDESVQMMSVSAARDAITAAGLEPGQVDAVIVATVSHLMQTPAVAPAVAHELGLERPAAFDISAACAGFCYGLGLARDMVRGGSARHVLVIGVERLSDITDRSDRGTAFIFADGAGAVVVGPAPEGTAGVGPVVWGSDGEQFDLIRQREDWRDVVASDDPAMPHLVMQGNAVFRWAAFEMGKVAAEILDRSDLTLDDIDAFVPHQANRRITDVMARSLHLPERIAVAHDIVDQGNTSAASVPLALHRLVSEGAVQPGQRALLVAFGAGLAYAGQVVTVPPTVR
ncbi:beta-ketoacyl-ACP synthase III [Nocardioides marmoribigeumensis]|uniref:Beta-ketoacyl-[acyl-carrier-protein] synthase III n=1 Tax=Nocardioides marmoribigeumensis TaxID=433649 RepID=A0ABU2BQ65_9ACTN|nr:beta-ketoacyl-ACP synthase III [Nocardioides marmoribigeumensis]MDR7360765.1 3-oxoacyl-[acyl-carrier-protein] synthase-3 [Nocardioides marmoribigeumensis]